jgi:hypothetical protein
MIRTKISDTDPKTGAPIDVPVELRRRVQRATTLLEAELPADSFEIDAHWQFATQPDGKIGVILDLTTPYGGRSVGYTGYPFDADVFVDDSHIRRGLDTPVWNFNRTLAYLNKLDIKHIREKAAQLQPLSGE